MLDHAPLAAAYQDVGQETETQQDARSAEQLACEGGHDRLTRRRVLVQGLSSARLWRRFSPAGSLMDCRGVVDETAAGEAQVGGSMPLPGSRFDR